MGNEDAPMLPEVANQFLADSLDSIPNRPMIKFNSSSVGSDLTLDDTDTENPYHFHRYVWRGNSQIILLKYNSNLHILSQIRITESLYLVGYPISIYLSLQIREINISYESVEQPETS